MIEARGLTKRYGTVVAVDGLDFAVPQGEAFGLLGPNGAGKSTTMRMLAGTSLRTDGELRILGIDPNLDGPAVRSVLGVVPQGDTLDTELRVFDNLVVYGRYFGLSRRRCRERAEELLAFAQLEAKRDARIDDLSGGMKRRLTIARALMNDPRIILLDEPTTGLDPQARHVLWERLLQLKERGATLVLTTHYMDEAEQLCDRIVVVDGGRIVAEGSPLALIREHASREVVELRFGTADKRGAAARLEGVGERVEVLPDRILVYTDDGEAALAASARVGIEPQTSLIRRASLEDVFLTLTGRSLVE